MSATQADGRHRPARADARRRARRRSAGSGGGPPSRSASTRTCWSTASSCSTSRATRRWRRPWPRTSRRSRPRPRCGRTLLRARATRGTSRRSTARCTTSRARYPFDARARGLPGPHHHRHARRADLPVPADRVAPLPGAGCCRPRRRGAARGRRGQLQRHRPRPLEATTASPRASREEQREGARRSSRRASTRATPRFNRLDRAHRAGGDRARATPILLTGPTGAGKSQLARRIYELKQAAAAGGGRVRRGQLRDAARRRRRCPRCSVT